MKSFSEIVKYGLSKSDKDVNELSEYLEVTPQHVYSLLRGKRRWNEDLFQKSLQFLGIEIEERTVQ